MPNRASLRIRPGRQCGFEMLMPEDYLKQLLTCSLHLSVMGLLGKNWAPGVASSFGNRNTGINHAARDKEKGTIIVLHVTHPYKNNCTFSWICLPREVRIIQWLNINITNWLLFHGKNLWDLVAASGKARLGPPGHRQRAPVSWKSHSHGVSHEIWPFHPQGKSCAQWKGTRKTIENLLLEPNCEIICLETIPKRN